MTAKQVTRFQCSYCKKTGYSASHMAKHERHCTMNPNRVCRVCKLVEELQKPMANLTGCLPQHSRQWWEDALWPQADFDGIPLPNVQAKINLDAGLKRLYEATSCPACVLSAIRQSNIPVPMTQFDFSRKMKEIWDGINDAKMAEEEYR